MPRLFGTDGIRARADERLVALAADVGAAVAAACREGALGAATPRPRIAVGRDTRRSGPAIEDALVGGLVRAGADAFRLGELPTPGVAYVVASRGMEAGVVISASHNPATDNGIKLFGPGGWKLAPPAEERLERTIGHVPDAGDRGHDAELGDGREAYVEHLLAAIGSDLGGLRVVVDCANGAASDIAPLVLERAGARVDVLHAGDGDINDGCGATHPDVVADAARSRGVVGLTFDGDADRVLAADESGRIVDGDALIALIASRMRDDGALAGDAIAITVMANQALRRWCADEGIAMHETPVGDRHVLETMRGLGLALGGEQSGHIIRLDRTTTGDGLLAGLNLLDIVASAGAPLAKLVPFRPMPQVLVNVAWDPKRKVDELNGPTAAVEAAQRKLGSDGRILVRPSGTEPLLRVMVEAPEVSVAEEVAELVAAAYRKELG